MPLYDQLESAWFPGFAEPAWRGSRLGTSPVTDAWCGGASGWREETVLLGSACDRLFAALSGGQALEYLALNEQVGSE